MVVEYIQKLCMRYFHMPVFHINYYRNGYFGCGWGNKLFKGWIRYLIIGRGRVIYIWGELIYSERDYLYIYNIYKGLMYIYIRKGVIYYGTLDWGLFIWKAGIIYIIMGGLFIC